MNSRTPMGIVNRLKAIQGAPTTFMAVKTGSCHESLLRAYQILEAVKILLKDDVPFNYILALIILMEESTQDQDERVE